MYSMKILILCTGNSCRSQMAHGFLQSFDASLEVYFRSFGSSFQIKNQGQVYQSSFTQQFPIPLEIPEKSDIDMRAITSNSGGGSCFLNFDLLLYKYTR